MLYIRLDDMVVKRAEHEQIASNTKAITNMILLVGLGGLIANGTIGLVFIGEVLVLGVTNRATKWLIKNRRRLINKVVTQ